MFLYQSLNVLLEVFHTGLILFNVFGWIWHRTRRLHLAAIGLTIFSWFGLGVFYGWGYCPSTDWHWQVKYRLGETNLPSSYVTYSLNRLTGISWDPFLVNMIVLTIGVGALVASVWLNARDWKRSRKEKQLSKAT